MTQRADVVKLCSGQRCTEPLCSLAVIHAMRAIVGCLFVGMLISGCGGTAPISPTLMPDPASAVVRIEQTGGMLPPWETLNWYPRAVLYADGRLIAQGPQIEIYPGPALPNLQVTQLTEQGIAAVLDAARDAGFVGSDRHIGEPLLDSGVTVITIAYADGTHRTTLQGPTDDLAVVAAMRFADAMLSPRAWLDPAMIAGDDRPYAWDRLQIVAQPMTPDQAPDPGGVSLRTWPLGSLGSLGQLVEPTMEYRCAVIEGADVETLRPALEAAHELTLWESDGATFQLRLHPLLPDEQGCAGT